MMLWLWSPYAFPRMHKDYLFTLFLEQEFRIVIAVMTTKCFADSYLTSILPTQGFSPIIHLPLKPLSTYFSRVLPIIYLLLNGSPIIHLSLKGSPHYPPTSQGFSPLSTYLSRVLPIIHLPLNDSPHYPPTSQGFSPLSTYFSRVLPIIHLLLNGSPHYPPTSQGFSSN